VRDILTVMAGLVVLALIAALAAPAFVDWNQQRATIEAQLSRAVGVEVVTTGPIKLRLLPSPRISIAGLRVGDADPLGSRLTAQLLVAEVSLTGFLRGEVRVNELALDGADIMLAARGDGVAAPGGWSGLAAPGAVGRLSISRGNLRHVDAAGSERFAAPFALQATQIGPGGPWRIEGEVARRSLRIATGDRDPQGRLRLRVALVDGPMRGEFDGWAGLALAGGVVRPGLSGAVQALWPGQGDAAPLLSIAAQAEIGTGGRRLTQLAIESAGAGRLEGEANLDAEGGALTLRGRRIDLGAWLERMEAGSFADDVKGRLALAADRFGALTLGVEQFAFRGEEASDVETRWRRDAAGWRITGGKGRFAGASAEARGAGDALLISLDSPDMRRIALALQRLGLPDGTAADLGSLGDLKLEARLSPAGDGWRVETWRGDGRFGVASGTAAFAPNATSVQARVEGADLLALMRPAAALATLAPGRVSAAINARDARLGQSPPGQASLSLARDAGVWSLREADASGFDGVSVQARRSAGGEGLDLSISAERADAVAAVAERLTDARGAARALRALRGVSPLRLTGTVRPQGDSWRARLDGAAGPLAFSGETVMLPDGRFGDGALTLAAADRGLLFRAIGLPAPASRAVRTTLTGGFTDGTNRFAITGEDGLSVQATIEPDGRPFTITFSGPLAGLMPPLFGRPADTLISGRAQARLADGALLLDDIAGEIDRERFAGALTIHGPERVEGRLTLPSVDAEAALGPALGVTQGRASGSPTADGWSGERFVTPAPTIDLDLKLASARVRLPGAGAMAGSARLRADASGLRLTEIALSAPDASGAATLTGDIELDRSGSERALRARIEAKGVDLSALGPDFIGQADLTMQIGAFGDSPARLAASLNGGGEIALRGAAVARFDPAALERIAANTRADIMVAEAPVLAQGVRGAVETAPWPLADRATGFLVAGGVARLAVFIDDKPNATGAFSGLWDARSGQAELRAAAALKASPRGWTGAPPQIALNWRGPWRQMRRGYDVAALSNALSQKALQREIERVEAFEADIRERAMFARRLRLEREQEEARRRAEAEALREQQEAQRQPESQRQQGAPPQAETQPLAPPLPPPLNINPVPQPLSRQPARAN
jgi:hypothetical protein